MHLVVSELEGQSAAQQPVEIVERKGLGHPDSICDAVAEEVSLALSRFYMERFGFVLHHNVDKVLLRGGAARPAFGGGHVEQPMDLYLAGRATQRYAGVDIPVEELAIGSARAWLSAHLHALDVLHHVKVHCLIRPGSSDLVDLFERERRGGLRLANDTSMGVGFAPLTPLESAVLAAEQGLRQGAPSERGEDTKVMGVRVAGRSELTTACAFVDRHLRDLDAYLDARRRAGDAVRSAASVALGAEPRVDVNAADDPATGSVYMTVTGTSAEAGDDGQTGRGNRGNGLMTPGRPMTLESIAGKNPINHVGKLYNVIAMRIAESLVKEIEEVQEAHVLVVCRIGAPIGEPQVVNARLRVEQPGRTKDVAPRAREIVLAGFEGLGSLWEDLLFRNLSTGERPAA
jgi:S-adenosylmethionine synthetase